MSQSAASGPKKSNRQGILRIFRQSVKELGCRSKTDSVPASVKKETDNSDGFVHCDSQQNSKADNKPKRKVRPVGFRSRKKSENELSPLEDTKECSISKSVKDTEGVCTAFIRSTGSDKIVEAGSLTGSAVNYHPESSKQLNFENDCNNNYILQESHCTVLSNEDWEKELEQNSETRLDSERTPINIENNLELWKENTIDCNGNNNETLKCEFKQFDEINNNDVENDHINGETAENVIGDLEAFSGELDRSVVPLHSTPKKRSTFDSENYQSSLSKRELNFDNCEAIFISSESETEVKESIEIETEKQLNLDQTQELESNTLEVESKETDNMSRIIYSSKGSYSLLMEENSRYSNRNRSSTEFERPPRFKSKSDGNGKKVKPESKSESVKDSDNNEPKTDRQRFSEKGSKRCGSHRYSESRRRNENYGYSKSDTNLNERNDKSRNSSEHVDSRRRNNGNKFQQKCMHGSSHGNVSLLDLNIVTPEKWRNRGRGRRFSECSDSAKSESSDFGRSSWKIPESEDWSSEMYEIDSIKDKVISKVVESGHSSADSCALKEGRHTDIKDNLLDKQPVNEIQETEKCSANSKLISDCEKMENEISIDKLEPVLPGGDVPGPVAEENVAASPVLPGLIENSDCGGIFELTDEVENVVTKLVYLPPVPVEVTESENKMCLDNNESEICFSDVTRNITDVHQCEYSVAERKEETKVGIEVYECRSDMLVPKVSVEISCQENNMEKSKSRELECDGMNCIDKENTERTVAIDFCQDELKRQAEAFDIQKQRRQSDEISDLKFKDNENKEIEINKFSDLESLSIKSMEGMNTGRALTESESEIDIKSQGNERHVTAGIEGQITRDCEDAQFDVEWYNYNQYARYWYEQSQLNVNDQCSPWHGNYPYNYETYCGWYEMKQYEMEYYWNMYYSQMQCADEYSPYYPYYEVPRGHHRDLKESEFHDQHHRHRDKGEEKTSKCKQEAQLTDNVNVNDRKSLHSTHTRKKVVNSDEFHTDKIHSHRSKAPDPHHPNHHNEPVLPGIQTDDNLDVKHDEAMNGMVEPMPSSLYMESVNRKLTLSETEETASASVQDDKTDLDETEVTDMTKPSNKQDSCETERSNHSEKLLEPCTCKPSKRLFMIWRVCDCEAGNPPRLHQILSNIDDRSLDWGYQSYESLECDVSIDSKRVGQKAPGFVVQPLSSSKTSVQNCEIADFCTSTSLKGKSPFSSGACSNRSGINPPPGFTLSQLKQMEGTGLKKHIQSLAVTDQKMNNERRVVLNILPKRNVHGEKSPASLRSLVEQQNLQQAATDRHHSKKSRNKSKECLKGKSGVHNSSTLFGDEDYPELPTCLNNGAQHLKQAHIAIAKAEMSQEQFMTSLKTAVDIKINDLQGRIEKVSNTEELEKENLTDSVEEKEKLTDSKTTVPGKQRSVVLGTFTTQSREILHEDDETRLRDVNVNNNYTKSGKVLNIESSGIDYMMDNSLYNVNATNKSWRVVKLSESSKDESGTSGDENNNITVYTQSPLISDDEPVNIRPSIMVDNYTESPEKPKKKNKKISRKDVNENCFEMDNTGTIPMNEMMETEGLPESSGQSYRREHQFGRGPRMCYRGPRMPMYGFPPPYRGGAHRPPFLPVSYPEHWPVDPRYALPPPPPPPPGHWSVPRRFPMYNGHHPHAHNSSQEGLSFNRDSRMISPGKEKMTHQYLEPSCPLTFNSEVDMEHKVKENGQKTPSKLTPSKLVDYGLDSSDDSSEEIAPFDCSILSQSEPEYQQKVSTPLKHTPKKLKTNTDDDTSSIDSRDSGSRIHAKGCVKLSRGHTKKLKQKALKSFSHSEKPHHRVTEDLSKKEHKSHKKEQTLSEIVAETYSTRTSSKRELMIQEFPAVGAEEKQLSPLPPLPPFPNSPFWSMYTPGKSSALTGRSEEKEDRRASTGQYERRAWDPQIRSRRFSYSPAGGSNLSSPLERDREVSSIQKNWRTNFKLFHSFGVRYIDTHCHLDFIFSREGFKGSFKAYMDKHSETFPDTFEGCVAVFCNPNSFTPSGGLWQDVAREPNVWIAMGCHPKMATDFTAGAELGLKKCLRHPKCIALGEIGLDYSGTFYKHVDVQKRVFRKQLKMAIEMAKVLVIHCRDAEDDCLEIMKEIVPPKWKIHCHCFTNGYDNAKLWIDAFPNLFIGVTPLVTYKTAKPTHDLARRLPITKLLLETDSPYFIPRCIPREDMPFSNPGLAVTVAKEIAQYQELPVAAVLRQCRLNTNFMYGI